MKKSIGAILLAVATLFSVLGLLLPYGSVKVELFGVSESESIGSMLKAGAPPLYWILLVVAIAATVMAFMKKSVPAGILGALAGVFMIIILIVNDGQKMLEKELGDFSAFGLDLSDSVKFSNGIGWILMLISIILFIGGAVICFVGKDDSVAVGGYNNYNQYSDPNAYADPNQYQNPNQF